MTTKAKSKPRQDPFDLFALRKHQEASKELDRYIKEMREHMSEKEPHLIFCQAAIHAIKNITLDGNVKGMVCLFGEAIRRLVLLSEKPEKPNA